MEKNQKANSWKKKLAIGAVIYVAVMLILITVAILMSTEVPVGRTPGSLSNFNGGGPVEQIEPSTAVSAVPATAPVLGPESAKVTIMEFSDFQCPYCREADPIIKAVLVLYPQQVRLVYRHFPIESVHPLAHELAHASMCAQEQGKFWEFHDRLFQYQNYINEDNIDEQAAAVGLDINKFGACNQSQKYNDVIQQDLQEILSLGGRGTPAWLVNGELMQGVISFEQWKQIIDSLL